MKLPVVHIIDHRVGNRGGSPPERPGFHPVVEAALRERKDLTGDVLKDLAAVRAQRLPVKIGETVHDAETVLGHLDQHEAAHREWQDQRAAWQPDAPGHIYRAAIWVACPPALLRSARPIKIRIDSAAVGRHDGTIVSNIQGAPCGACPGKVEPLTHVDGVAKVPEEIRKALESGEVLEFVLDDAGGQHPDHWTPEETFACLMGIAAEIEAALAELAARHQLPQRLLIGQSASGPGGA